MKKNILVVDDEPNNLALMKQVLAPAGYRLFFAKNGEDALKRVVDNNISLVLLDIMMPGIDGYEVCRRLKADVATESIPVIFVTAMNEQKDEKAGFELGAVDYITKPISPPIVLARVKTHLSLVRAIEVEKTRSLIIKLLGRASEYKDNETGRHILRMSHYAQILAGKAGMSEEECDLVLQASPMHDVGKIGVADHVLAKPEKLTPEEWETMRLHPAMGAKIIGDDDSLLLRMSRTMALTHHEKWDGSGYPEGLAGENIPLEGRIVAIADVFDALTSARPYKDSWPVEKAVEYIKDEAGKHFDPALASLFIEALPEILKIRAQWPEDE